MADNRVYQIITDKVISLVESTGKLPWRKPWSDGPGVRSYEGTKYKGLLNGMILGATAQLNGWEGAWLTYQRALKEGGNIRKGEHGTLVTFWKPFKTRDEKTGKDRTIPFLRYYTVFSISQCDGVARPKWLDKGDWKRTLSGEEAVLGARKCWDGYQGRPSFSEGGNRAMYSPTRDTISMPLPTQFGDLACYWSVMFHEMIHSTGVESRLDRKLAMGNYFGSPDYSREELVAEMGAAFLGSRTGIDPEERLLPQHAGYVKSWIKALQDDPKAIVFAAGRAQKAAAYILGESRDDTD